MDTALNMLRDKHNTIKLELPVSGDIDSPDLRAILSSQSSYFIIDSEARYQERFSALQATVERSSENEMRLVFLEIE